MGLINKNNKYGILKKFFIKSEYRGKEHGVSKTLCEKLLLCAKEHNLKAIILGTPSICTRAHNFYLKMGYQQITKKQLPIEYNYPDRDSLLFIKFLNNF